MTTIVTRSGKGSPLTHNEVDANFTNLNNDKVESTNGALTNPTLPSGTVNGVAYLNGSKVLTTGSALTFNGTNIIVANGVLTSQSATGGIGYVGAIGTGFRLVNLHASGDIDLIGNGGINLSTAGNFPFKFSIAGTEGMRLTSTGLGIGTTSPAYKLDVTGQTRSTAYIETKTVISASAIDLTAGNYFTKTISGSTTFTTSGTPATGNVASFVLDLTNGGSAAVTWWSGVKWASGTAPTLTASGRDVLGFFTHDGGTTWNGFLIGKAMA